MKTYEGYSSSPDGWNVSSTLELEENGRFSYSEGWTDYTNASLSGGAGGTWRRGEGATVSPTEGVYSPIYFPGVQGQEVIAKLRDGALDFGRGWELSPPTPPSATVTKSAKPVVKPAVRPPVKPPVTPPPNPPAPPFVPRAPSPELAALIRRWIEEL